MYGGDFDHVRIIPHLSVSFLSVRRFMITSVCLCPLNLCPSLHDYSFTRKLTVLLGSAAFSTSPSADLDSSEICQRLTQAEYRQEVAMYQLISLERCSRPATVASEENEGGPMIGRFRPHMRTICRDRRRITSGAEGGACSAQKQAEAPREKRLTNSP